MPNVDFFKGMIIKCRDCSHLYSQHHVEELSTCDVLVCDVENCDCIDGEATTDDRKTMEGM